MLHNGEGAGLRKYIIHGGNELHGEVSVSGFKNAALAIVTATILVDGTCVISNIPKISNILRNSSIPGIISMARSISILKSHRITIMTKMQSSRNRRQMEPSGRISRKRSLNRSRMILQRIRMKTERLS